MFRAEWLVVLIIIYTYLNFIEDFFASSHAAKLIKSKKYVDYYILLVVSNNNTGVEKVEYVRRRKQIKQKTKKMEKKIRRKNCRGKVTSVEGKRWQGPYDWHVSFYIMDKLDWIRIN